MSATTGKVALVNSTTALTSCPGGAIDLIGFGTATCFESAVAPAGSNTTALVRGGSGCTDSNDNSADFTAVAPAPRNSTNTTALTCGGCP